jgi:hypothetical protein
MKPDAQKFGEQSQVENNHCQSCGHPQGAYRDFLREKDSDKRFYFPVVGQGGQSA